MEEKVEKNVQEIDLDDILPNRFQPRVRFDEEELTQLANSIKKHGVIQPIIVREIGDKYEIIAGERRYKASVLAGKTTIPVIVNNANDARSNEIALIENIQRQDLTPIEEAASYKKILEVGNLTQEELAQKIEKKQSTISNKLRLLNLCDEVQEALMNEQISERHARALLRLKEKESQIAMLNKIINERLTVRHTDAAIDKILGEDINIDEIKIEDIEENKTKAAPEEENSPMGEVQKTDNLDAQIEELDDDGEEGYRYEYKPNPGFLDIDNIEKTARDINEEKQPTDWKSLLKEEDTPEDQITQDLASQGISVEKTQKEPEDDYGQEQEGRFFRFSPGELIEKEEEKPVPEAPPKTTEELTGFNFQYKGAAGTTEITNLETVKNRINDLVDGFRNQGTQIETEEIDLEDQFQVIIKVKKD